MQSYHSVWDRRHSITVGKKRRELNTCERMGGGLSLVGDVYTLLGNVLLVVMSHTNRTEVLTCDATYRQKR